MKNYLSHDDDHKILGDNWPRIGTEEPDKTDPIFALYTSLLGSVLDGKAKNVFSLLKKCAVSHPSKPALRWLNKAGEVEVAWNYGEFLAKIRSVAYTLSRKYEPGERVVLCFEPGLDFFVGFWACLATGLIAVPACPPDPFVPQSDTASKLDNIISDCDPVCVLTSKFFRKVLVTGKAYCSANSDDVAVDILHLHGKPWLIMDKMVGSQESAGWDFQDQHVTNRSSIAFLQYTSGSTGKAKGVMVSHGNLVENGVQCIAMTHSIDSFKYYKYSIAVSWLPTFHDMGLIGFHVSLMMCGVTVINFSPLDFISNPAMWLKAMSKYRRVITGGPPFALDLCVRKVSQADLENIDLKCVSGVVLGAEPIRQQSLDDFANKFSSVGFNRCSYLPCYGLAENVLFVIGKDSDVDVPYMLKVDEDLLREGKTVAATSKTSQVRTLVSSGERGTKYQELRKHSCFADNNHSWSPSTVLIVNIKTFEECKEGEIGEIWVTGPCKAIGYWNKPKQTQETFGAVLKAAVTPSAQHLVDNKTPCLRTGDMGSFVENRLYVTGRYKDALIFNGTNYYPHDIEDCVLNSHLAIKPGSVATVSVEDKNHIERMCVLLELRDKEQQTEQRNKSDTSSRVAGMVLSLAAVLPTPVTTTAFKVYKSVRRACGSRPPAGSGVADWRQHGKELTETSNGVSKMRRQYTKAELSSVLSCVSRSVQLHFGLPVHECVVLAPKSIKKTSSGKLRRQDTRDLWRDRKLDNMVVAYCSAEKGQCERLGLWNPDSPERKENGKTTKLGKSLSPCELEAAELLYESSSESSEVSDSDEDRENLNEDAALPVDMISVKQRIITVVKSELSDESGISEKIDQEEFHDLNLLTAGVDSLTITKLSSALSDEFNLKQPLSAFMFISEPTLNGVSKVIVKLLQQGAVKSKAATKVLVPYDGNAKCPCILGIGTVVPDLGGPQELVLEAMSKQMGLSAKKAEQLTKIGKHSAIETRHTVLKAGEDIFWGREGLNNDAGMELRNECYKKEAPKLAIAACTKALQDWGGNKKDITHVVSVSCTGIIIPGLEFQVMVGLDLPPSTERLSITFMGCFGALSGLKAAAAIASANPKNRVLVVCCELCSLHMQMNEKIDNLIASVLFSDGCGAFVVGAQPRNREKPLFQIHKTASSIIPNTLSMMSWELSATGFIIGLSKEISGQIFMTIKKFCRDNLLKIKTAGKVKGFIEEAECHWAIHPGGAMIVQAIQEALGVTNKHSMASWETMRDYGNMSSATLVFVWDNIRKQVAQPNQWVPSLAFGPGLNVEGALLRRCQ